jgi:ABC-2 type transport system permease protein
MLVICLEERLAYRSDFALGTVMRFLPIVTQVFLWTAVFAASSRTDIAGYSRDNIVAYYLLTMVTRAFSSMPSLAGGISRSIRDGSVKKYLIQPIDLHWVFACLSDCSQTCLLHRGDTSLRRSSFFSAAVIFLQRPMVLQSPPTFCSLLLSFLLGFFFGGNSGNDCVLVS